MTTVPLTFGRLRALTNNSRPRYKNGHRKALPLMFVTGYRGKSAQKAAERAARQAKLAELGIGA